MFSERLNFIVHFQWRDIHILFIYMKLLMMKNQWEEDEIFEPRFSLLFLLLCFLTILPLPSTFFSPPPQDNLYLIQELCDGGEIMKSDQETNEPLNEEKSRQYLRQMILGIEFCHRNGIIHRDIKPENVLLSSEGVVKICDFGVACRMEEKTTMPKGTPGM